MATFTGDAIGSPQLAASLLALGIAPLRGKFVIRVGDVPAEHAILYRFENGSPDGLFSTRQCIGIWRAGKFPATSDHPFHAMGRMWTAFRANADALRRPIVTARPQGVYSTEDRLRASALEAMGHRIYASCPLSKMGDRAWWHFEDTQQVRHDGEYFCDKQWLEQHPDETLAYLSAAAINWWRLVDNIKTATPFAVVRHKDKHIAVGANSSQKVQDKFGQLLEGKWRV